MNRLYYISICRILILPVWMVMTLTSQMEGRSERDSLNWDQIIQSLEQDLAVLQGRYLARVEPINRQIAQLDQILSNNRPVFSSGDFASTLEKKMALQETLRIETAMFQIQLLRTRYLKGMELIKLIYEKVLSLDHHFTTVQTLQQISSLSNPNAYPEFQENRKLINERLKKKDMAKMPLLLQKNPYLSATYSLVSTLFSDGEAGQKEKDLEQIACILDFTVRMNTDLNTIYYETAFLKQHNLSLKENCLSLFADYTKPIGYFVTLERCRKEDDWESIIDLTEKIMKEIEDAGKDPNKSRLSLKHQINLEFSIDRLLDFINKYDDFINQGEKYYHKFLIILSNYENEASCAGQLPRQFGDLKNDVKVAIDKFAHSYRLTEIKGSKLKDLLYGLPDN